MRTDDFDFDLPEALIALAPARPRDTARLLVVSGADSLEDRVFHALPAFLRAGDVLVRNVTHVIPAALTGTRPGRTEASGAITVQFNLLGPLEGSRWQAFARPGKRLRVGDRVHFSKGLEADIAAKDEGGLVTLTFNAEGQALDALIAAAGAPPLPPYIVDRRPVTQDDTEDYQTVYADLQNPDRSVAAPTAGLHFTKAVFEALAQQKIGLVDLSLAVGAGTFLPVKTDDPAAHVMHEEFYTITAEAAEAINRARHNGGRVIAVGTTALRALESAPRTAAGELLPARESTKIFITPGFQFGMVDGLLTNFHLPRSTLFMLVCAFAGFATMHKAYAHAIKQGYRFYSYGDSSLLWRARTSA
jgi:S-adenosylmethionine:tRNA ribosyltransferase-isomerase